MEDYDFYEALRASTRYVSPYALFVVMVLDRERTHDSVRWLVILNRRIEPVCRL
jgi:hypothetical protein